MDNFFNEKLNEALTKIDPQQANIIKACLKSEKSFLPHFVIWKDNLSFMFGKWQQVPWNDFKRWYLKSYPFNDDFYGFDYSESEMNHGVLEVERPRIFNEWKLLDAINKDSHLFICYLSENKELHLKILIESL